MHMKERIFWSLVALSTVCAAIFGYHRFRQIRPDLHDRNPAAEQAAEQERLERIKAYHDASHALAWGRTSPDARVRQHCVDGHLVEKAAGEGATPVLKEGKPVACGKP